MTRWPVRVALVCVLAGVLASVWAAKPDAKAEVLTGKVVPLADVVAKAGGKLDADAAPAWLALVTDAGKVYPLVKDDGSRLFFLDKALLNRPVQLTARLVPNSTLLRVSVANSVVKGKVCEVYYWCDICSIRRGEKHLCECCGGPMDLKEEPLKP